MTCQTVSKSEALNKHERMFSASQGTFIQWFSRQMMDKEMRKKIYLSCNDHIALTVWSDGVSPVLNLAIN